MAARNTIHIVWTHTNHHTKPPPQTNHHLQALRSHFASSIPLSQRSNMLIESNSPNATKCQRSNQGMGRSSPVGHSVPLAAHISEWYQIAWMRLHCHRHWALREGRSIHDHWSEHRGRPVYWHIRNANAQAHIGSAYLRCFAHANNLATAWGMWFAGSCSLDLTTNRSVESPIFLLMVKSHESCRKIPRENDEMGYWENSTVDLLAFFLFATMTA